jgi:hypothetical protein
LFLQLAEPLTSNVIYPFAPQVCVINCALSVYPILFPARPGSGHNEWERD